MTDHEKHDDVAEEILDAMDGISSTHGIGAAQYGQARREIIVILERRVAYYKGAPLDAMDDFRATGRPMLRAETADDRPRSERTGRAPSESAHQEAQRENRAT